MASTKKDWNIENAKTASKQHCAGNRLDGKLGIRTDGMNVIIKAESKDQAAGQQNGEQGLKGKSEAHGKMMPASRQRNGERQKEREKNRDTAKSRKGTAMQVALKSRGCHPSVRVCQIAHVLGQHK
jgi:hypothetical protein